jgi:N-acetylglucosamine-6-phosphate deacetylase
MNGLRHALVAEHVFDGDVVHRHYAVIIQEQSIVAVVPRGELPADMPSYMAPSGTWLAPGFVDIQVNGGGDVLFNDEPTPAAIRRIVAAHRRFGTTALLPTLISDTPAKMRAALSAVQSLSNSSSSVLGIHFEGPFLSPQKSGAHDPGMIRRPSSDDIDLITSLGTANLVTLAPEVVPAGFVTKLVRAGVRVALGHSMATYAQTLVALKEGLTGFTHLFNAMRPLTSREPGPIAAALETKGTWFGMIVDGVHVAPAMLRLALRGSSNPILVTDAMPPAGGKQSTFVLHGQEVKVRNGACVRDDNTLAGTALTMAETVHNSVQMLGVPLAAALRFASAEPARFLGVDDRLGRLKPGARADLVALRSADIDVIETWVAGDPGHQS